MLAFKCSDGCSIFGIFCIWCYQAITVMARPQESISIIIIHFMAIHWPIGQLSLGQKSYQIQSLIRYRAITKSPEIDYDYESLRPLFSVYAFIKLQYKNHHIHSSSSITLKKLYILGAHLLVDCVCVCGCGHCVIVYIMFEHFIG